LNVIGSGFMMVILLRIDDFFSFVDSIIDRNQETVSEGVKEGKGNWLDLEITTKRLDKAQT